MELFPDYQDTPTGPQAPLADRMRPEGFEGYLGQEHLVGEGRPLRRLIEKGACVSFILWGPPGSGKTTLARLAARLTGSAFHEISAVGAGVADIRKVIAQAKKTWLAVPLSSVKWRFIGHLAICQIIQAEPFGKQVPYSILDFP